MVKLLRGHRTPSPAYCARLVLALAIPLCSTEPAAASGRHPRGCLSRLPGWRWPLLQEREALALSPRFGLPDCVDPRGRPTVRSLVLRRCRHLAPTDEGDVPCIGALYFLLSLAASVARNFAHSFLRSHRSWSCKGMPVSVRARRRTGTTSGPSPCAISARAVARERPSSARPTSAAHCEIFTVRFRRLGSRET